MNIPNPIPQTGIEGFLNRLNGSSLFAGCVMLLMNIGGKHLAKDLPTSVDKIFEIKLVRRLIVFCVAFVATRNVKTSLLITLIYILVFSFLLNEKSRVCILPAHILGKIE